MSGGRLPDRSYVESIVSLEAWRHGLSEPEVLGAQSRRAMVARKRAWFTILDETGCSVNGLATVWGCERQAIRRASIAAGRFPQAVNTCARLPLEVPQDARSMARVEP